jgi:hypothetical protein
MTPKPDPDAKLFAELDAEFGIVRTPAPKPRPAKLCAANGRIVREVEVRVSPDDPNYIPASGGFVQINFAEAERQWAAREADQARERARRKALDPFNFGHWGAWED